MKKRGLVLLFAVLLLGACGRKPTEIDLIRYVRYDVSGINGKGKMFLSVDEELYADAAEQNEALSEKEIRRIIEQDVVLSVDKDRLLSNGNEVVVEVSCMAGDEEQKAAGVHLLPGSKTVKIAGLPEAREIDLTENVLIETQGFNGQGTLSVSFAEKLYNTIADLSRDMTTEDARTLLQASVPLRAGKSDGLSDGDTVKITVDAANANAAFEEQGLVLKGGEVSYTVSGLDPLQHFQASDYVSYTLTGTAPYMSVSFSFAEETPQELIPLITLPEPRAVTLQAEGSKAFEIRCSEGELKRLGYVCDETAFSVSLDGFSVEKYVEALSEISEADMQKITEEAYEAAYAAALYETQHLTYNEGEVFGDTLEKVSLSSKMLFVRKHYMSSRTHNYLVLVYQAEFSPATGYGSHDDILYVTLTFETVKLDPSGSLMDSEPVVEIKLPERLETDITVREGEYSLEEIKEE